MDAIVNLLLEMGWNYISLIFEISAEDTIQETFRILAISRGICIAYSKGLHPTALENSYPETVDGLLTHRKARVVIILIRPPQIKTLFEELNKRNETNWFIWIGNGRWTQNINDPNLKALQHVGIGSFTVTSYYEQKHNISSYLRNLVSINISAHDWLRAYWEEMFNCQWKAETCNETVDVTTQRSFAPLTYTPLQNDAIWTLVRGLKEYILLSNGTVENFNRSRYLQVLRALQFDGVNGKVRFDENGNMFGDYVLWHGIKNQSGYFVTAVGSWATSSKTLLLNRSLLQWNDSAIHPESVCSKPCPPRHIRQYHETRCCWECIPCRPNERVAQNESKCIPCPQFWWPNQDGSDACQLSDPIYITASEALGIGLITTSCIGLISSLALVGFYIRHNGHALIKSSCREASYMILLGTIIDFGCIPPVFIGEPTLLKCYSLRFSFHLTSTLIYAPILMKILKIFRIFLSGRKSTRMPKFVEPRTQILVIAMLIFVEVILLCCSVAMRAPQAIKDMPDAIEPVVEMFCDERLDNLAFGLAFNLALVGACSMLAFKARKLPQNFNESAQIAFCVNTTLLLWIIFIPAYTVTSRAGHKTLLLSLAMTLNALVPMTSLFAPKVYAVSCIRGADQQRSVSHPNSVARPTVTTMLH